MASPQLEDGFTRTANELQEAFCKVNLSPYEGRVIRAVERKTFGFGKKEDRLSLTQIAALTGLDTRHIHRTVKSLIERHILSCKSSPGKTSILGIQKNYELWVTVTNTSVTSGDVTPQGVTCRGVKTITSGGYGTITSGGEYKRKKKERKKQFPENFTISEKVKKWAKQKNVTGRLETEFDKFKAYHLSKGSTYINWDAAFRNWLLNSLEYKPLKKESDWE